MEKRRRSQCWSIFTVTETGKASCGLCGKIMSFYGGATSNLIRHIKMKHPDVELNSQNECQPLNLVVESLDEVVSHITNQPALDVVVSHVTNQPSIALPIISDSFQSGQAKIASYIKKPMSKQKNQELDYQLVKMMVKEFQPLPLVENKEFKKLINMLNSGYSLPSKKTISSTLIPQLHSCTMEKIKDHLKSVKAVSITAEGWTSVKNDDFIAVTAHFCNEDCELKSYLLDCFQYSEKNSVDNLAAELKRVISEWDLIDKIAVVVCDETENIKTAVEKCEWTYIPCFAHALNFIVQAGIQQINVVTVKVKSIVEFFRRSPQATLKLLNSQKQMGYKELKLKQDVPTRWNSTYEMLLRFIELKEPILLTLAIVNPQLNQLQENDWLILKKACDLLGIFQEVAVQLKSESVTLPKVILVSKALMKHVSKISKENDLPEEIKKMASVMDKELSLRFSEVESDPILAESTILDPRFKQHGFQNENSFKNVCESLQQRLTSMYSIVKSSDNKTTSSVPLEPSTSALWEDFDFKMEHLFQKKSTSFEVIELDKYLQEPNILRKEDPLVWWRDRKHLFPNLYEIMKSRLSIPATSVPCERIFSESGQVLTERRNRLPSSKVAQIMFLNVNL